MRFWRPRPVGVAVLIHNFLQVGLGAGGHVVFDVAVGGRQPALQSRSADCDLALLNARIGLQRLDVRFNFCEARGFGELLEIVS